MEFGYMASQPIAGRSLGEPESCWDTRGWGKRRFGKGFEDSEKYCDTAAAKQGLLARVAPPPATESHETKASTRRTPRTPLNSPQEFPSTCDLAEV